MRRYLWGEQSTLRERVTRVTKGGRHDAIRGSESHYRRACQSYWLPLWDGLWGEPYLKAVTPDYLRSATSNSARLPRGVPSPAEIDAMERTGAMEVTADGRLPQAEALPDFARLSVASLAPTFSMR